MAVSSISAGQGSLQIEAQKKAQDVQAQQVTKVIESATEQSRDTTSENREVSEASSIAQKTGLGNSLNIAG